MILLTHPTKKINKLSFARYLQIARLLVFCFIFAFPQAFAETDADANADADTIMLDPSTTAEYDNFKLIDIDQETRNTVVEQVLNSYISVLSEIKTLETSGELSFQSATKIIKQHVEPIINPSALTDKILGKNKATATAEQKTTLGKLYVNLIVNAYAALMSKFDGHSIEPREAKKIKDNLVSVNFVLTHPSFSNRSYKIRVLSEKIDGQWYLVDGVIAGLRIVPTYRRQSSSIIKKEGIEQLILRLQKKVQK